MAGMGVLHLDVAVNLIKDAKVDIITSEPLINYREDYSWFIRGCYGEIT